MAKKKNENTLQYLQMPLPSGGKYSKMTKVAFGGLNKRYTLDSGALTMENNISTSEYPYLTPSKAKTQILNKYSNPISMFAFENFLLVIYQEETTETVDNVTKCITTVKVDYVVGKVVDHTGIIAKYEDTIATGWREIEPRSIVQFNVYDTPTDPLTGKYVKKLLIFPDKVSMYMNIVRADGNPTEWNQERLDSAALDVMYYYGDYGKYKYYTVASVEKTEKDKGYDKTKKTYKNILVEKSKYTEIDDNDKVTTIDLTNMFACDGMEAIVKEYKNSTPEADASGAIIYPPPETASHNYYYRNSYNNDIYRWCEYETVKREEEFGVKEKDDGSLEVYGFETEEKFSTDGGTIECYIPDGGKTYGWKVSIPPAVPNLKYATVHLSRVFGVDDDRVYASGFNDYTNWNLDTIDEYNESNSWCSPSQSNTKAGGKFTGITNFQGHIVCFKRDFMHEIYNTKNPFRLTDIYAEGTIDNRTIQDVDGKLIFVSEDDVKVYTGSNPRIIGYNLNMSQYTYAVSGTDNRNYYLYCEDDKSKKYLYVYDTFTELWSEQSIEHQVLSFAHNKNGMYMLCDDGCVYKMDTDVYADIWSFETDLITNKTVDIKHIKKLQMLVELESEDTGLDVYILYDNETFDGLLPEEKPKRLVYSNETRKRYGKFPIRVKPRNTANYGFKLHIEGSGYVKLYELEIFVEAGGDLYV